MTVTKIKVWHHSMLLGAGIEVTLFWDIRKEDCTITYLDYEQNAVYSPDNIGFIRHEVKAIPLKKFIRQNQVEGWCEEVAPVWLRVWEVYNILIGIFKFADMKVKLVDEEIENICICPCEKMKETALITKEDTEKYAAYIEKYYSKKITLESDEKISIKSVMKSPDIIPINQMANPMFDQFMSFWKMFQTK